MSKRRRHSRSRIPAAAPKAFSAPDISPYKDRTSSLLARDGFANPVSFLGESSALFSAGTFVRSGLTQDPEKLTTLYRESWLAKKIIDMPAEDMTRAWYTLSADLPEEDMDALKNLEARHAVRNEITNAIRWARLYGGSIALMVIRGDEDKAVPAPGSGSALSRLLPGASGSGPVPVRGALHGARGGSGRSGFRPPRVL